MQIKQSINKLILSLILVLLLLPISTVQAKTLDKDKSYLLDTITVTASSSKGYIEEDSGVGTKTNTPVLETPQAISIVSHDQMEFFQPSTPSIALRYTSGASSERYGASGDSIDMTRIRGVDADYYLDGLRIISNSGTWLPQINPYFLEKIEVLRGPCSALYGQGTGGGIVNQISKIPKESADHELFFQYGSHNRMQVGVDSTGPLDKDKKWLYRLVFTGLGSEGQVDDTKQERYSIMPSLTWKPDNNTYWTFSYSLSREPNIIGYNSFPAVVAGLNNSPYPAIDFSRNYTNTDFENTSRTFNIVTSSFKHRFKNLWNFTSNIRYMKAETDMKRSTIYGYQLVKDLPWLKVYCGYSPAESSTFSTDNYISGVIDLGVTQHTILMGADCVVGRFKTASFLSDPELINPYSSNYQSTSEPNFTSSFAAPWTNKQDFTRTGIYLQDQIAYDHLRLTLNIRHDWSKTDSESKVYSPTVTNSQQKNNKWSGRVGLSYLFDIGLAPYLSYSTAFSPVLGSDYNGVGFSPIDNQQYELGVKYQPKGSSLQLSAAIYTLKQTNVKTTDTDHMGFYTQKGKARSRGIDLQASGEIIKNLNLIASYSFLDNELIEDTQHKGKTLTQTPENSASVWLDYLIDCGILNGLKVGCGVRYIGSTLGDQKNSFKIIDVTLTDMAANYDLGFLSSKLDGASIALNISNITDKKYIASSTTENYCFPGQRRTILLTLSYRW